MVRPAQNSLSGEVKKIRNDGIRKEIVAVKTVCKCHSQILNRPSFVRYSSRWNGVDAIESISMCMSSVEDEETTFLAANSDSWALEAGSIVEKCHRVEVDSPFAFFQRFQQADHSILFLN